MQPHPNDISRRSFLGIAGAVPMVFAFGGLLCGTLAVLATQLFPVVRAKRTS